MYISEKEILLSLAGNKQSLVLFEKRWMILTEK